MMTLKKFVLQIERKMVFRMIKLLSSQRTSLLLLLTCLAVSACGPAGEPRVAVDPLTLIIYHNGTVLTMEEDQFIAEAIAIRGETIEAVGSDEEVLSLQDAETTLIDLDGRTLMPGFVDAHSHVFNERLQMGLNLDGAQHLALSHGITTVAELFVKRGFLIEMQEFEASNYLRVRTSLYLLATDNCGRPQGDWYTDYPPTRNPGEMLRIGGVKIIADGGTCGDPALSFELEPGAGTGDLFFTQAELNDLVARVQDAGYQAAIHAIGDRAIVQALNAIEHALEGKPNTLRHRMEHNSVTPPEQRSRYGELGVIPVLHGQSFT
jgi:predicted amidohydrolase YtcJ